MSKIKIKRVRRWWSEQVKQMSPPPVCCMHVLTFPPRVCVYVCVRTAKSSSRERRERAKESQERERDRVERVELSTKKVVGGEQHQKV